MGTIKETDVIGILTKTKMHTVVVGPLLDHGRVHCVGLMPVHCVGPHSGPVMFYYDKSNIGPEFGLLCFLLDGGLFISYTFIFLITAWHCFIYICIIASK